MEIVEETFEKTTEEYKAMKWLKDKIDNCNDDSLTTHYYMILYYLVINLLKKNNQIETNRDEAIKLISIEFLCFDNESDEYIQGRKAIEILERGKE